MTMRVGINGMGRIGRLALRAAMGAAWRGEDDPRAGNRLEVVHLNEINNPQVYAKFTLPEDGSYQTITSSVQPSHLPIPTQFVVRSDDESEQETFRNPLG